jgi:hypothetical protein
MLLGVILSLELNALVSGMLNEGNALLSQK